MKASVLCDQDCNHCQVIRNGNARQLAAFMNAAYAQFGGRFLQLANEYCPNLTCCPICHIDDFCHLEGGCAVEATVNVPSQCVLILVGGNEPYKATCGRHKATSTCSQEAAARACAAKALGLCPPKCPPGKMPSDYYRMIARGEQRVNLRRSDANTFRATVKDEVRE